MEKIKILIDTDPGDDIDDALALAYVLKSGFFEVVGVTTTFKDTDRRARIVKRIFELAGADIPVFAGYGAPLLKGIPESQEINQYTPDLDAERYKGDGSSPEDAVDFIISACEKHQKELVLCGIGPLCNLSRALQKSPSSLAKVGRTVIMGGCFNSDYPEWNMYCDPDSAKVVFEHAKDLLAVGVELTSQTKLSLEQSLKIEKDNRDEFFAYIGSLVKMWRATHGEDRPTLHDILAICTLRMPQSYAFERGAVTIDADGKMRADGRPGACIKGQGGFMTYATAFDKDAFMREFMSVWD